jgi:hypothetical protein
MPSVNHHGGVVDGNPIMHAGIVTDRARHGRIVYAVEEFSANHLFGWIGLLFCSTPRAPWTAKDVVDENVLNVRLSAA